MEKERGAKLEKRGTGTGRKRIAAGGGRKEAGHFIKTEKSRRKMLRALDILRRLWYPENVKNV